jgi:hypothetical protein
MKRNPGGFERANDRVREQAIKIPLVRLPINLRSTDAI